MINLKKYIPIYLVFFLSVIYFGVSLVDAIDEGIIGEKWNYVFCVSICLILYLSGLIATLVLITSGIKYMTSEAPEDRDEAKNRVTQAAVGLTFVLIAIPLVNYLTSELFPAFECDCTSIGDIIPQEPASNETLRVIIHTPADDDEFYSSDSINFFGSVHNGIAPCEYRWTSSIDGSIGNKDSFSESLSAGEHIIMLNVTDWADRYGSDMVNITVVTPP